jgi:hypothetical protein
MAGLLFFFAEFLDEFREALFIYSRFVFFRSLLGLTQVNDMRCKGEGHPQGREKGDFTGGAGFIGHAALLQRKAVWGQGTGASFCNGLACGRSIAWQAARRS